MALRVLLADESPTIKKVIQIALQDYSVEVRSVQVGLDALEIARQFKPDLILADILLQKKNGYEVASEIKKDPGLGSTPVVLIWSGFMKLDQNKYKECKADAHLEKPFDPPTLRELVQKLIPKARANPLAAHLSLPDVPPELVPPPSHVPPETRTSFDLSQNSDSAIKLAPIPPVPLKSENTGSWNMESFEDLSKFADTDVKPHHIPKSSDDEFESVPLQKVALAPKPSHRPSGEPPPSKKIDLPKAVEDDWKKKDISRFKLDLPEEAEFDAVSISIKMPMEEISGTDFLFDPKNPGKDAAKTSDPKTPSVKEVSTHQGRGEKSTAHVSKEIQYAKTNSGVHEIDLMEAKTPTPKKPAVSMGKDLPLSIELMEEIVRSQAREILENMAAKVLPDIATRIIQEELNRLLKETHSPRA